MIVRRGVALGLAVTLSGMLALPAWSQDTREGEGKPPEMSAEEKAWMEAGMPGENHKLLEHFVGTWDVATTMYHGEEVMTSKGKSQGESVLGGRYVADHFEGEMMGMRFQGMGVTGYDNVKKKFVSGWIDNMSTGIFTHEGTYDAAKKEFTFTGSMPNPMGGEVKSRMTIVLDSADQHTMTMYHSAKEMPEMKVMQLVYTRARGGDKPADGGNKGH